MEEFAALMTKRDSYETEKNVEDKKTQRHKKDVSWKKLRFENYKHCLETI